MDVKEEEEEELEIAQRVARLYRACLYRSSIMGTSRLSSSAIYNPDR